MSTQQKPILHGRDHSPGGADPIPGLGGIQFETYPQAGEWLYVETTGAGTSPSGYGMEFFDDGANGIDLASGSNRIDINAFGSDRIEMVCQDDFTVNASGDMTLTISGALNASSSGDAVVSSSSGISVLQRNGGTYGPTWLEVSDGVLTFLLNGTPIFKVDGTDSSYHILTGAAWTADL